jgi:hypothetical protein
VLAFVSLRPADPDRCQHWKYWMHVYLWFRVYHWRVSGFDRFPKSIAYFDNLVLVMDTSLGSTTAQSRGPSGLEVGKLDIESKARRLIVWVHSPWSERGRQDWLPSDTGRAHVPDHQLR